MKMTDEGLALIRRFEGFRSEAYRDAVGVWTIGYGHTSMAGAPVVIPELRITTAEAAAILARDVKTVADGVAARLEVQLSGPQFSALVSFAFNVGLGNFRKSGVLKAVNAGDLDAVPRRLNLWVKAGGRTLPGLVRRRAAEGAMFAAGVADNATPGQSSGAPVEPQQGKHPARSRTVHAALLAAAAALAQGLAVPRFWDAILGLVVLGAAAFIVFDRIKKLKEEGV